MNKVLSCDAVNNLNLTNITLWAHKGRLGLLQQTDFMRKCFQKYDLC